MPYCWHIGYIIVTASVLTPFLSYNVWELKVDPSQLILKHCGVMTHWGNKSHVTVNPRKEKSPKIFLPIWLTFYWLYSSNSQASFPMVISQPAPFLNLTYTLPPTLLIRFSCSLSLSLSPAYSPLHFYLSLFHTKRKLFERSASLNELISLNSVLHLIMSTQ